MLAIILSGAALMREREHGTIEHLLVMPLSARRDHARKSLGQRAGHWSYPPFRSAIVVQVRGVPIAGSIPLFMFCTLIYMFSVTALGIFLATLTRSMPQFGLLAFPVFIVMNMLSGATRRSTACRSLLQDTHADIADDAFRELCPDDPLPRRRTRSRGPHLAAVAGIGRCSSPARWRGSGRP